MGEAVWKFLLRSPRVCAVLSAVSIADALNCVRLDHADWFIPAAVAFGFALLVREPQEVGA